MPMQIKSRTDTAAHWTSSNPILAYGELGFESDTNFFKRGDGTTHWTTLPYVGGGGGSTTIPADVLRNTTTGTISYQSDNTLVGAAFVIAGYYVKTATGWDFPPHLQEQSFERFAITSFPYTLNFADMRYGTIFLQPTAAASVILPNGLVASPAITNVRTYQDVLFYIDGAVVVTFTPAGGAQLFPANAAAAVASLAISGPRRSIVLQARSTNYRVLD